MIQSLPYQLKHELFTDLRFYGGEKTALPQASMPTIYKQHLYNMTPYTLKIWARSWKNPVPRLR